jgi:hypothetical protein
MQTKITMTHVSGSKMIQIRKTENVARTIKLAKQCGYVKFETETTYDKSKSGL